MVDTRYHGTLQPSAVTCDLWCLRTVLFVQVYSYIYESRIGHAGIALAGLLLLSA